MITRFGKSVRVRLALLASIAMALLCLAVDSLVLYGVRSAAEEYRTNETLSEALRVVHLVKRGDLGTDIPTDVEAVQVLNAYGKVVASSPNVAGRPPITTILPSADQASRTMVQCDLAAYPGECMMAAVFRIYQDEGDWYVYALDYAVPWYVHPLLIVFMLGLSGALVTVTWWGTSRTVARTLAPVDAIRAKLADITATDLGQRVPVPDTDDEIRALAETANATLDRLEQAVEQQRRFASDASHDLRTPITAMRAQVEEAMLHPEDADWEHTGRALLESLDRLQAIVTDLLTLARLDAGAPVKNEPIDLARFVAEELDRRRPYKAPKEIKRDLQPEVLIRGDRLQLARLLTNLLDNAERHAESQITVTVARSGGKAVLEVLDDGAGIAPDQREVVFRRFTRLDASRNRDAGGTGLGLPIAREIAHAHHGTLTIEDSDTGARFVLRLPPAER
ncbi:sensor histidine kinase [Thermoactinospora rubra]|uniref:sensor histidine kinase n=1 Tax=Thermoactinospora rubra TaxID=1088767 RepID=UPI001F0A0B70|nr:HAMP domain-containing sensor histidine kinase [Thermoactinospora rubra]